MLYESKKECFKLDFRTKIFISLLLSYILILGNLQQKFPLVAAAYSLLPYVFLFLNKEYKTAFLGLGFIVLAYAIQRELLYVNGGPLLPVFLFVVILSLRLLPGALMARYAISSSTMSEITSSLKKIYFPDAIVIPITVMARFFHTAKEDYHQVKDAMYLHGLTNLRLLAHPVKLFEYRIVPLLMVLTKTADDVAVSAMTRGLRINEQRTYIYESRLGINDYFVLGLMLILMTFYFGAKYA